MKSTFPAIVATVVIAGIPLFASGQVDLGIGGPCYSPESSVSATAPYAPPPQPAYSVEPAPYPNSQLVPGYWGWGPSGYYWVPAYWTAPPAVGYYWTPGYWSYSSGAYVWLPGYWGPTVGFYGGISYGFGYFGTGFVGGSWSGGVFNYNTAVVNVNRTVIHNTYSRTVINNTVTRGSRVSFNGSHGGISARPTAAQLTSRRLGLSATSVQRSHQLAAAHSRNLLASVNHGHPKIAAVQKPLRSTGHNGALASAHRGAPTTAHRNATMIASRHGGTVSGSHHGAPTTTHRNATMVASHHGGTVSGSRHGAPSTALHGAGTAGHGYSHLGMSGGHPGGGYPHYGMYGGRPGGGYSRLGMYGGRPGGGYSHLSMYGGRPGGGGYPHSGMYGGRPGGGFGGHPGGGGFGGHPGGGGGRPPRG
ncbi:MAG TPA: YXWGXW repeat-containing protein [Candidatus Cybelea sp.]